MTASPQPTTSPAPRPLRKRRRRVLLVAVWIAVPLAVLGYLAWESYRAEQELAAAEAEADRLDPGWRLMDLEANRKPVPLEHDAAPIVTSVGSRTITILNTGSVRQDLLDATDPLKTLSPHMPLTAQQAAQLRAAVKPFAPVLPEARKVVDLWQGRYPTNVKPTLNWIVPNVGHANLVVWILTGDAAVRIQDEDVDGAWTDCQAVFNIARSLGDEPVTVVQGIRASNAGQAIRLMERTLAHGTVAEPRLARTQALVEDELNHPMLLIMLRGWRGFVDQSFRLMEAGQVSVAEAKRSVTPMSGPPDLRDKVAGYLSRGSVTPAHAWLLRYLDQAVEIAKGPKMDVEPGLEELQKTLVDAPELARLFAPKLDGLIVHQKKRQALLDCALAALAAERYRLTHNAWPASLDVLVAAKLLTAVPVDPYDGKALRYRALPDGVVVYAVGSDGRGNGDALDGDAPFAQEERLEFRLWHAERRGPGR